MNFVFVRNEQCENIISFRVGLLISKYFFLFFQNHLQFHQKNKSILSMNTQWRKLFCLFLVRH